MTRVLAHVQSRNLSRVLNAKKTLFSNKVCDFAEGFLYAVINTSDAVWIYPSILLDFYT